MKDIKNYKRLYAITEDGQVWSYPKIPQNPNGRFLKQSIDHRGYPKVTVKKNWINKNFSVHRLVAEAYIPNKLKLPQVNHINGNKLDNTVANLEWCTAKGNTEHAIKIGLRDFIGKNNPNYKDGKRCKL